MPSLPARCTCPWSRYSCFLATCSPLPSLQVKMSKHNGSGVRTNTRCFSSTSNNNHIPSFALPHLFHIPLAQLGGRNKMDACLHTQHLGTDIISNLPEHLLAGSRDMFLTQVPGCISCREGLVALVGDRRVERLSP